MLRPTHIVLATVATAVALGGAGVAFAAGGDDSNKAGAGTRAKSTAQSNPSHCDHDNESTDT